MLTRSTAGFRAARAAADAAERARASGDLLTAQRWAHLAERATRGAYLDAQAHR